ncbi:MAG: GldG family protein [Verrucomicrobiota bacterium]
MRIEDFRMARWVKRINRFIQVVLALSLAASLNYIAARHFIRQDITRTHRYSLSPETLAYLTQIEEPVRIIVTEPADSSPPETKEIFSDIENLLREFEYAARVNGEDGITVDYVNVYANSQIAEELVSKYNVKPETDSAIVVVSGDEYHEVFPGDLYAADSIEEKVFTGEQAFMTAILDVMQPDKTTLYFTSGHGEMRLDDVNAKRGLSQMATFLRRRNFLAKDLDLTRVEEVPEEASMVFIVGPQTGFLPEEQQKLRAYLEENDGRLAVLLDPAREHGLEDLFYDWGILADDMIMLEASNRFVSSKGDMLIANYDEHPITDLLRESQLKSLFGLSRPVRIDPGAPPDDRLQSVELMTSSKMSWGERNYKEENQQYDPKSDLPGPVSLAVASERVTGSDLGLDLQGGRVAVFGNAGWVANSKFFSSGNPYIFHNLLNWMLDREEMVNIPPRVIEKHQLLVSREESFDIFLRLLLLPGGVALLGIIILSVRRR